MPTRSPTLVEVLDKWREGVLRDLHVALPCKVTRYDSATQRADVKPFIADFFYDEDDQPTTVPIEVIPNVPVQWPRAGGYALTLPLVVGDTGYVLVTDRSMDAWLAQGSAQAPADERRHHLKDAVFVPGLHDNKHPIPSVPTDGAAFGSESGPRVKVTASQIQLGGTDETVACAGKVASELSALWTALNGHAHASNGVTPTGAPLGSAGSVASSIAKVKS